MQPYAVAAMTQEETLEGGRGGGGQQAAAAGELIRKVSIKLIWIAARHNNDGKNVRKLHKINNVRHVSIR